MFVNKSVFSKLIDIKDLPQILAIITSCIPALSTGLLIAWPSPSIPKIINDKKYYNITEAEASYFSFLNAIGPVILSPFASQLCDILGRKWTLMLSAIPHAITWLMKAFCTDLNALYTARALGGIGDTFMYNALPMYIGEILTPKVRGIWGNGLIVALYLGLCLINTIGAYCSIQATALICLVFPVIFVIMSLFIPESPYFYAMRGDDSATLDSLKRLRGTDNVETEFSEIKSGVKRQMSEPGTWKDVLMIGSNRKACFAGIFLRVSQNFCGLITFTVYAQYIFENVGNTINPKISSILYTGITFFCYLIACYFSDKMGRRLSYIISISLCTIPLFGIGIYFAIKQYDSQQDLTVIEFIPLLCMIVYIVAASCGTGLVPTLMLGELFSTSVKVKCLSIVTIFFSLTYFAANNTFYYLSHSIGIFAPFLVFGGCNIVSAFIAAWIIPETKGKTLEEIQQILRNSKSLQPSI